MFTTPLHLYLYRVKEMEKKYLNEKLYSCWGYREFGGDQFDHSCIPIKLLFLRLLVEDEIGTLTIQGDGKSHG